KLLSGDLDVETALRERDDTREEVEQQKRQLLGESAYAQLDGFVHDVAAGDLVKGLNRELGSLALTEDQSKQVQALFAAKPDVIIDDTDLFRSEESLEALFQTLVDRGHRDLAAA